MGLMLGFSPLHWLITIEGRLLSIDKQVAIAIRRLASEDSQVSAGASDTAFPGNGNFEEKPKQRKRILRERRKDFLIDFSL